MIVNVSVTFLYNSCLCLEDSLHNDAASSLEKSMRFHLSVTVAAIINTLSDEKFKFLLYADG